MNRKWVVLLCLVLTAALLCACAAPCAMAADIFAEDGTAFSDMVYERPDLKKTENHVAAAVAAAERGASFPRLRRSVETCSTDYYDFQTMYVLAEIRSCLDMTDGYWAEEYAFCREKAAEVDQLMEELYYACAACRFAQKLEKLCFWGGFCEEYSDPEDALYNDETVRLLQQEAALLSEYDSITAAPTVEINGRTVELYDYLSACSAEEYYTAINRYHLAVNEEIADIYIRLIAVRRELAVAMGYDDYRQMQYEYFFERDYTPEDAESYTRDVRRYAVPLYTALLGLIDDPYAVTESRLNEIVGTAARKMGGAVGESYDFMARYGLFDLAAAGCKADMCFTNYIENYAAPYVFINPCGGTDDILAFTHELGHAADAYYNYNANESIDLAECFSQGLEMLLPAYMDDTLSEDMIGEIYRLKLWDALESYVQQASFAEFENRVYALPESELCAEKLNAIALDAAREYGYCSPGRELYFSLCWMDVVHFFMYPFYVISYPVSADIAMQLYAMERNEKGAGVETYFRLLPRGAETLVDAAQAAGLESPFAEGRVQAAVNELRTGLLG